MRPGKDRTGINKIGSQRYNPTSPEHPIFDILAALKDLVHGNRLRDSNARFGAISSIAKGFSSKLCS